MKRVLIIVVLLFISQFVSAQIKLPSKNHTSKKNVIDSLLAYTPKPYFLQFSNSNRKVTNLCSMQIPTTQTLFEDCKALREIDLNDLKNRTKWVFYRMKMWQYFR